MNPSDGTQSGRSGTITGGTSPGGTITGGTSRGGTITGGTVNGGTLVGGTVVGAHPSGGTLVGQLPVRPLPEVPEVHGLRLHQLLLITTVLLVVVIVSLLASMSWLSTQEQFQQTADAFRAQLQDQARELGQTVSHTLSLTSATSLRDNNYAFLSDVATQITKDNRNVLRVQLIDADGVVAADSDPSTKPGTQSDRPKVRKAVPSSYHGQPIFEFQEPMDYGSSTGKGLVVLSYSLEQLEQQLRDLEAQKVATLRRSTARTLVLGLGFVLVAAVIAAFQSRRVTRPLGRLTDKVRELASGDLSTRVDPQGSAEVQTLGLVFNTMADRINVLLEDVKNKAVLEREMQLAQRVQETLLPSREPYVAGPIRVAGVCFTADQCGGDWWIRAGLDSRRVVIGVGDVTGHGLSTALVATSATSAFAAAMKMREASQIDAAMLCTSLNQILFHVGRGEYQMSTALAVIDVEAEEVDFAAGAHPNPCVFNRFDGKLSSLAARGALLGASNGSSYQARRAKIRPGDIIVWYTDGLTECRDGSDKLYGFQRLCQVVQANKDLPAELLRDAIVADAKQYSQGMPQQDDITVVVAQYLP